MPWKAKEILTRQRNKEDQLFAMTFMSLADFKGNNFDSRLHMDLRKKTYWAETLGPFLEPYQKAIISFLSVRYEQNDSCTEILENEGLDVKVNYLYRGWWL